MTTDTVPTESQLKAFCLEHGGLDVFTAMTGSVRRLSHTHRYETFRTVWRENVAEHSFYAAFLAWTIAQDLYLRDVDVDPDRAAIIALMGDLEEALSSDVITIFKNSSKALKREIKKQGFVMAKTWVMTELGAAGVPTMGAWGKGELHPNLPEAEIAKFADLLCVVMYAREEYRASNDAFYPVLRDIHRDMQPWRAHPYLGQYVKQVWPNDDWADAIRANEEQIHTADKYPGECK